MVANVTLSRLLVLSLLLAGCSAASHPAPTALAPIVVPAAASAAAAPRAPVLEVLVINGGGNTAINYQSHLRHVARFRDLVVSAGVPEERITVLASDGADPKPDLATRETPADVPLFRLDGTRLERALAPRTQAIDSTLPGVTLEPATRGSVMAWFARAEKRLHAGDTLLLYVTDHGTRKSEDPLENRITLWGEDEAISVREFSALVGKLDPGVRVVALMSECYSGGFSALAATRLKDGQPLGNVCGYFSSTSDRPAYGCYPENRGKDDVGHSFEFMRALAGNGRFAAAHEATLAADTTMRALAGNGRFAAAHEATLAADTTPDVPLRTSDAYLQALVHKDADAQGVAVPVRVDALLREAFADAARFEPVTRLLDRIARTGGSFSPRSLAELDELAKRLPDIDGQLGTIARAFHGALADVNATVLERFLGTRPDWNERLTEASLGKLGGDAAPMLGRELLSDLVPFTAKDAAITERISALHARGDAAEAASYRMDVRLAIVLRMRTVLTSLAGRVLVEKSGTPEQKAALSALTACEDFSLPVPRVAPAVDSAEPAPYQPFEEEVHSIEAGLPGFLGIVFKEPTDVLRTKWKLSPGASMVSVVYPDSPAKAAGLEVGDLVLGQPGAPFSTKNQIRAWTMLSPVGKSASLEILREGKHRVLSVTPAPYPVKWPSLPGPVQVGTTAPKVDLKPYRGAVAEALRKRHVLYFWATWCGPCKAALPELLAFEKETKTKVVAVTDEEPAVLDAFIKKFASPFPNLIAMDELRRSFVAYGVGGTPMFVLVDEHGKVLAQKLGYDTRAGLEFPGWTWSGRAAPSVTP
jgi:thiol-disulfide isomerase/thioredoxin